MAIYFYSRSEKDTNRISGARETLEIIATPDNYCGYCNAIEREKSLFEHKIVIKRVTVGRNERETI